MTTKVVYFTVGGKPEQAEFSSDFPADEIKGNPESRHVYMNIFIAVFEGLLWTALCYWRYFDADFVLFKW